MPGPDIKMRRTLTIVSLVVFFAAASSSVEDSTRNVFDQCILPLGMEEGKIPDDAITASSSYETKSVGPQNASYGDRLNFITQIASGMKYLESMNIPHCDLAARNCIVDQNLTIKISDHAMYCSKYDHHYYIDGCNAKIPLRWMAWEAVLLSMRSCQADVWSFAVTVWEVFMNCKEIPYPELTAEQVLENCGRWYQSETCVVNGTGANDERNRPRILARPNRCSDDLYRMMNKCWSKRTEDRPTFEEIYLYLERLALD